MCNNFFPVPTTQQIEGMRKFALSQHNEKMKIKKSILKDLAPACILVNKMVYTFIRNKSVSLVDASAVLTELQRANNLFDSMEKDDTLTYDEIKSSMTLLMDSMQTIQTLVNKGMVL